MSQLFYGEAGDFSGVSAHGGNSIYRIEKRPAGPAAKAQYCVLAMKRTDSSSAGKPI